MNDDDGILMTIWKWVSGILAICAVVNDNAEPLWTQLFLGVFIGLPLVVIGLAYVIIVPIEITKMIAKGFK
jgi:uncharacterized membrane protein HdeD (DUF308 family)